MTAQKIKRLSLPYPTIPVFQLLLETALCLPGKLAVIESRERQELSFTDLEHESDILAGFFFQWGIKKGDRISFLHLIAGNIS